MDFAEAALRALTAADPQEKVAAAGEAARLAAGGELSAPEGWPSPPDRPARPAAPKLVSPGDVPRRRLGTPQGKIALLHALAHIEFNAIDLAFDMATRFVLKMKTEGLDWAAFVQDWAAIGGEEARHFEAVDQRLNDLGSSYGDLPAHDGLWSAALSTSDDPLARLAIAPLVLEARGLDVTPTMIEKLTSLGDIASASVLSMIYREEVGHVAAGVRWFDALCERRGLIPSEAFRRLVCERFAGGLKPPFNRGARDRAGLAPDFYEGAAGLKGMSLAGSEGSAG